MILTYISNNNSIAKLKSILEEFSAFSGLQINFAKSHITFSKAVKLTKAELAAIFGLTVKDLPFDCLGIPITCKS